MAICRKFKRPINGGTWSIHTVEGSKLRKGAMLLHICLWEDIGPCQSDSDLKLLS